MKKNLDTYKEDNTPIDWILRDLMIDIQNTKRRLSLVSISFIIYASLDIILSSIKW